MFLVTDESRSQANEVANLLKESIDGAVVYTSFEGGDALKKMRNVPPAVFITSMETGPRVPFTDMVRSIEAEKAFAKIPICVISDITDCEPKFQGNLSRGKIKFISRPLVKEELISTVKAMLQAETADSNSFITLSLKAGEVLFLEGEKADRAFLVKKGKLKASRKSGEKTVELGEVLPGEFVGEMAHITGEPRSADVRALEDTDLIEIPCGTLDMLVFSKPTWTKALLKTLCRRLKEANLKRAN